MIWFKKKRNAKTYNRRDSQMVTHSSTSRPVQCLCMAERTGCPVLTDLWSYVTVISAPGLMICGGQLEYQSSTTALFPTSDFSGDCLEQVSTALARVPKLWFRRSIQSFVNADP